MVCQRPLTAERKLIGLRVGNLDKYSNSRVNFKARCVYDKAHMLIISYMVIKRILVYSYMHV